MRKLFIPLILIIYILSQITGCTKDNTTKSKNENQTIETTASKSKDEIRKIAYQSISEGNKKTVINWEDGKVEEYIATSNHSVGSPKGIINIKGKDTYKVTFRTNNEAILGPLTIYLDKYSYIILGGDLRD